MEYSQKFIDKLNEIQSEGQKKGSQWVVEASQEAAAELLRTCPSIEWELDIQKLARRMTGWEYASFVLGLKDVRMDVTGAYEPVQQLVRGIENLLIGNVRILSTKDGGHEAVLKHTQRRTTSFLGDIPTRSNCQFTASDFSAEFDYLGPNYLLKLPESKDEVYAKYQNLPQVVKELFFTNAKLDMTMPFFLARELIMAINDETWSEMRRLSRKTSKAEFNEYLESFVNNFIEEQRSKNRLKMGIQAVKTAGYTKPSNKSQAIAQMCKPQKWIARLPAEPAPTEPRVE